MLYMSKRVVRKFGGTSYFAIDGRMGMMGDQGAVAFELWFIKSKHCDQNMDAFLEMLCLFWYTV